MVYKTSDFRSWKSGNIRKISKLHKKISSLTPKMQINTGKKPPEKQELNFSRIALLQMKPRACPKCPDCRLPRRCKIRWQCLLPPPKTGNTLLDKIWSKRSKLLV